MANVNYDWAVNKVKLQQALEAVKLSDKPTDEESIRAEYVKRGGKLNEQKAEKKSAEGDVSPETTPNAPKKRGSKK